MADSLARMGIAQDQLAAASAKRTGAEAKRLAQMERLAEFRDAGLLTDSELEEQKARLRWGPV